MHKRVMSALIHEILKSRFQTKEDMKEVKTKLSLIKLKGLSLQRIDHYSELMDGVDLRSAIVQMFRQMIPQLSHSSTITVNKIDHGWRCLIHSFSNNTTHFESEGAISSILIDFLSKYLTERDLIYCAKKLEACRMVMDDTEG